MSTHGDSLSVEKTVFNGRQGGRQQCSLLDVSDNKWQWHKWWYALAVKYSVLTVRSLFFSLPCFAAIFKYHLPNLKKSVTAQSSGFSPAPLGVRSCIEGSSILVMWCAALTTRYSSLVHICFCFFVLHCAHMENIPKSNCLKPTDTQKTLGQVLHLSSRPTVFVVSVCTVLGGNFNVKGGINTAAF